jgi:membrane dipeptidase
VVCALLVLIGACAGESSRPTAAELAAVATIVDTHIDAPILAMMAPDKPGAFDLARARRGGLDVAFMSIFVPAAVDARGEGYAFADKLIDWVDAQIAANPTGFARATCVSDVRANAAAHLVSLALGMENGGPLAASADALEHFRARGVRYVTLTHAAPNAFADSSYAKERPNGGLSPAGKSLVTRLNDVGIMVDVSHVSDAAFWQALESSRVPIIASHSATRHFVPGFERNISDEMIAAVAKRRGVVQVNFGSAFVTKVAHDWTTERDQEIDREVTAGALARDPRQLAAFNERYVQLHPFPYASIDDVLDHIEHVVRVAGIEHVGLGSDFDGVGDTLPTGLKDVAGYPNLIAGLITRGYSTREIELVLGENLLRVWTEAEAYARKRGHSPACSRS